MLSHIKRGLEGIPTSMPCFSHPRKLKLGTAGFLQRHSVAGNFHLIYGSCEWRLNFDSVLVAEFVPATHVPDKDNAIWRKFPKDCVGSSHHPPLADNGGMSAASHREQ
jgi:hypothetical protein